MSALKTSIPEGYESKRATGSFAFQNPKNWAAVGQTGRMVTGTFIGLTPPNKFKKNDYEVLATEDGISYDKEGNATAFKAGTKVTLNASGSLISQMKDVALGDSVIIDFDGVGKLKKGEWAGSNAYNYSVFSKAGDGTIPEGMATTEEVASGPDVTSALKEKLAASMKKNK